MDWKNTTPPRAHLSTRTLHSQLKHPWKQQGTPQALPAGWILQSGPMPISNLWELCHCSKEKSPITVHFLKFSGLNLARQEHTRLAESCLVQCSLCSTTSLLSLPWPLRQLTSRGTTWRRLCSRYQKYSSGSRPIPLQKYKEICNS